MPFLSHVQSDHSGSVCVGMSALWQLQSCWYRRVIASHKTDTFGGRFKFGRALFLVITILSLMASRFDPLKIYYIVTLATDDPHDVTPFQSFSTSWESVSWALDLISGLPADVLERTHNIDHVIALRMGGIRPLAWIPLSINTLMGVSASDLGVFVVLFSGEKECAERIAAWMKTQNQPTLHISSQEVDGAFRPDLFTIDALQAYCIAAFKHSQDVFLEDERSVADTALSTWTEPRQKPSGLKAKDHNITNPNYMSLKRAARLVEEGAPFIGHSEKEYTDVILESVRAVIAVRESIGIYGFHYLTLLRPELLLAEPALHRLQYKAIKPEGPFEEKTLAKTLRWIQTQKGLHSAMPTQYVRDLLNSPTARSLLATRASEVKTFTMGIGLRAAQTTSAVVRLSPGVNHVFPLLSAYARNVRSSGIQARLKTRRLFDLIQNGLSTAVGKERLALIEERQWPVKIVSDAPIEWLPIGNLPLSLRYDCSRINATPGNLLMGLLVEPGPMVLSPESLHKILVLSSFDSSDPLKNVLKDALGLTRDGWEKRVSITFRSANTTQSFIDELNAFDGAILIFDGHGVNNTEEPVGKLMIGTEAVDVWDLRRKVKVPPIVLLSACDTQGVDASSHATVGNGFLSLGALTVLATLLPVGGLESAQLIARLVYRISDFIPAAIAARRRVLNWTEVVSGMLRMFLVSEVLDALVRSPEDREKLHLQANEDINSNEDERWFDNLLARLAEHQGQKPEAVQAKAQAIIARSEAIRYIRLGNPEFIIIDDGKTQDRLAAQSDAMSAHLAAGRISE